MIFSKPQERIRFYRFAVVGIIGAVIDFGIFNLLIAAFGILPVIASVCSFCTAVVSNFILNRYWTYPDSRSKKIQHQVIQFILVSVAGLGIRTPLFAGLEPLLVRMFQPFSLPSPLSPRFLGHNMALAIAIIVVMFWNFFANRFWTYADVE